MSKRNVIGAGIGLVLTGGLAVLGAKWAHLEMGQAIYAGGVLLIAGVYLGFTCSEKP